MSSAASPNPQNLLILAGIGIAAYWFMTRNARAVAVNSAVGQAQVQAQLEAQKAANKAALLGTGISALSSLLKTWNSPSAQATGSSIWAENTIGSEFDGKIIGYVGGGSDGLPVNPVIMAPYDYGLYF